MSRHSESVRAALAGGLAIALLTGCALDHSSARRADVRRALPPHVVLTASVSRPVIPSGGAGTLRFEVRNTGRDTLRLDFPNGCQLVPFVERLDDPRVVYPDRGAWACPSSPRTLTLAPGASRTVALTVRGGGPAQAIFAGTALPPGRYRAFASLGLAHGARARTGEVEFRID